MSPDDPSVVLSNECQSHKSNNNQAYSGFRKRMLDENDIWRKHWFIFRFSMNLIPDVTSQRGRRQLQGAAPQLKVTQGNISFIITLASFEIIHSPLWALKGHISRLSGHRPGEEFTPRLAWCKFSCYFLWAAEGGTVLSCSAVGSADKWMSLTGIVKQITVGNGPTWSMYVQLCVCSQCA